MHFAGLKAVGESCEKPLEYYMNNIGGTMNLLEVCTFFNIVYSYSLTIIDVFVNVKTIQICSACNSGGCICVYRSKCPFLQQFSLHVLPVFEGKKHLIKKIYNN